MPTAYSTYSSTLNSNNTSNSSSPFLSSVPRAPTPSNNATSSSGTVHENDSNLRWATNKNISPSPPLSKRSHLPLSSFERARTSTGVNVNQSPNADQKGVSLDNERILYVRTTCGETTGKVGIGAVRCSNVRSSGGVSSGKYTYLYVNLHLAYSIPRRQTEVQLSTYQITANDMRDRYETELVSQCLCLCCTTPRQWSYFDPRVSSCVALEQWADLW
jgi:hypothetical protein